MNYLHFNEYLWRRKKSEPVFVNLGAQESIPSLAGRYDNPTVVPARQAT